MKSGYKIFWTEHAASELEKTIQYLQTEFSDKEISKYRNENIGFIFQDFKLLDHLTVNENISLPIKFSKSKLNESYISKEINEEYINSNEEKPHVFNIKSYKHQNKSSSTNDSSFIEEEDNKEMTELLNELNGKKETNNNWMAIDDSEFLEISIAICKPRTSLPCLKNQQKGSVNSNKINMKGRILIGSQSSQVNCNENKKRGSTVVNMFDVKC